MQKTILQLNNIRKVFSFLRISKKIIFQYNSCIRILLSIHIYVNS